MPVGRHTRSLLLALCAWPAVARAEPPCRPVARVGGEPALAASVVPLLEERGVPLAAAGAACGVIDAVLTSQDGRVRVTIIDVDGGTVERSADDAAGAATAIESFVRSDVSAPLLAARAAPPAPVQHGDREPPPVTTVAAAAPLAAPVGAGRAIDVAVAAEVGVTGDGALWRGARVQGCVRVGPLCAGGLLRYAKDSETRGDSDDLMTSRMAIELAFLAELPLRAGGRLTLAPGVRAGMLSLTAERETLLTGESEDETYAAHVGAGVTAAFALGSAWSLRGDLAVGYSPFPRTVLGKRNDDAAVDERLAGAEHLHAWLGVGVGYGGL